MEAIPLRLHPFMETAVLRHVALLGGCSSALKPPEATSEIFQVCLPGVIVRLVRFCHAESGDPCPYLPTYQPTYPVVRYFVSRYHMLCGVTSLYILCFYHYWVPYVLYRLYFYYYRIVYRMC